jgi:uncharacterized protein (TIGR03435 family)
MASAKSILRLLSKYRYLVSLTSFLASGVQQTLPAQDLSSPLAFEVAAIHPSSPGEQTVISRYPGGRFTASKATFLTLLSFAYDIPSSEIVGGPGWIGSDRFDVVATARTTVAEEQQAKDKQIRLMLKALLQERFQLVLHEEERQSQVYALVVASGGSKLQRNVDKPYSIRKGRKGMVILQKVSLAFFAKQLSGQLARNDLGRPVIDKTDLVGEFDISVRWASDTEDALRQVQAPAGSAQSQTISDAPSIFTAFQEQLGLKLVSQKGPVTFVVVDKVAKPSEN